MAHASPALLAFNRGEVSRIALARVDVERMRLSAQCQVNWMPFVVGAMMLRPGLEYIDTVRGGDSQATLVKFVFAPDDTAQLELTGSIMRVRIDDELLTRPSVSTHVSQPNFNGAGLWDTSDTTSGCTAAIGGGLLTLTATARGGLARCSQPIPVSAPDQGVEHGLLIVVENGPVTVRAGSSMGRSDYLEQTVLDTGEHHLSVTPTAGTLNLQIESTLQRDVTLSQVTIEAAGTVEVATPWGANDLDNIRFTQSGDIIYVAAYGMQQWKIERRGDPPGARGWSVVVYRSDNGPFGTAATAAKLTPSVQEGNGTLRASLPLFEEGHVGALFRLFTPGQQNRARLGGDDAFTDPIRISGVGNDRIFGWHVSGTWSGRITLQRSFEGPTVGFVDVAFTTVNAVTTQDDTADFTSDNVVAWYRAGFKSGDYTSGNATVYFGQTTETAGASVTANIAGANTFSAALQISATLSGPARTWVGSITGDFTGTITIQKSTVSGVAGFTDLARFLCIGLEEGRTYQFYDTLDGTDAWYRIGCKAGEFTGGSADVTLQVAGSGGTGGSTSHGAAALASGRYGICRVTGYTSKTVVDMEVLEPFSSTDPASDWQESDWSDARGWPTAPALQEGRLWWLGRRIWGSQPSNFTGFAEADKSGQTLGDAAAIIEDFGEGPIDRINWGLPLTRLLCGREGSIASIRSSSFDEVVTPTNFSVKDCTEHGAARLPGIKLGKRGIYVGQDGRRVFELEFDGRALDYSGRDLTRLNLDIGKPGFTDAAAAVHPDGMVWLPRGDGIAAALLYDKDDEVEAWWRLMTMGEIEKVSVMPGDGEIEDRVYFIVKRTVNGATKRFIEKLALRDDCVGADLNKQLDSFVIYSGTAATSISLPHLPNTEVAVWADGQSIGTGTTNASGLLSPLPDNASHENIVAGLGGHVESFASTTPVSFVSGLDDFEGLPCEVFANQYPTDGMRHVGSSSVSAGGVVHMPDGWTTTAVTVCIGFVAPFMSAKLAYAAPGGNPLKEKKAIDAVGLLLYETGKGGVQAGQRFDRLDAMPELEGDAQVPAGAVWGEYSEAPMPVPGEWDFDARLCLLAQAPIPAKVGAAVLSMTGSGG